MDYGRPALADRLAAEYVLGTLRGPARRRFEALLPAHPVLRQALKDWEVELLPLVDAVPPVVPPADVWKRVENELFPPPSRMARWWRHAGIWRGATAMAMAMAMTVARAASDPLLAAYPPHARTDVRGRRA